MFNTQYSKHERAHCCSGNAIKPTYEGFYDENGALKLKRTGQINIYDEIQSHAESVDINTTLKKFANGDTGALAKVQGVYGDFTEMPKSYAEMLNTVINGERRFNELPVDIRAKFNHNFGEFVAGIGTDAWREKMSVTPPQSPPTNPIPTQPVVTKAEGAGVVNE